MKKMLINYRFCFFSLIAFGVLGVRNVNCEVLASQNFAGKSGTEVVPVTEAVSASQPEVVPLVQKGDMIAGSELSTYTLGKTDVIEVMVQRHSEVSGNYEVNNEGKIQFEFVGDIPVEGLTKEQVKEVLTQHLSAYIISPDVMVKITGYNSKIVYVIGEVGQPGKIFMRGDTITVREALVEAGLPLLSASTRKVRLITPAEGGKATQKDVNVYELLYAGDLRENYVMNPGDTLYIPATVLAKTMRVLSPITQPVTTTSGAAGAGRRIATGGF